MHAHFTRALLRLPGQNFAAGITTSSAGAPTLAETLQQHAAYSAALGRLGLALETLHADEAFPDGTFVEDTAILTPKGAILTRPGAAARAGETTAIEAALRRHYPELAHITAPGTVDGGDICESDMGFLIGVSARTNEAGAQQLAGLLGDLGYEATPVDIRSCPALLHLKTGISYLGEGRLAVAPGLPAYPAFERFEQVVLAPEEAYAANCIRVNDRVIIAAGYPRFADELVRLGYAPLELGMSEFQKMDGGLSCLSLRF